MTYNVSSGTLSVTQLKLKRMRVLTQPQSSRNRVYISAVNELSNQRSIRLSEVKTNTVCGCVRLYSFTVDVATIITNVYHQLTVS